MIIHQFKDSSLIKSFEYSTKTKRLTVVLKPDSKVYTYNEVPPNVVGDWQIAKSAGSYFNRRIKTRYHGRFVIGGPQIREPLVASNVRYMKDYGHIPVRSAWEVWRLTKREARWAANQRKHRNTKMPPPGRL
jgi:hypothetical protein